MPSMSKEEFTKRLLFDQLQIKEHKKRMKNQLNYDLNQCVIDRMNKCMSNRKTRRKYFGVR